MSLALLLFPALPVHPAAADTWDRDALRSSLEQLQSLPAAADHEAQLAAQLTVSVHVDLAVTNATRRAALEGELLALLRSRAPVPARRFACRQLGRVGASDSVPALSALLADETLSNMARYALERMELPSAGAALRDAATRLRGPPLVGVLGSLGERREPENAAVVAKHASSRDQAVAMAAVRALGKIGTPAAAKALAGLTAPTGPISTILDARLECAQALLSAGNTDAASRIYRALENASPPERVRPAVLRGFLAVDPDGALRRLKAALETGEPGLLSAAAWYIAHEADGPVLEAIGAALAGIPATGKAVVLHAFSDRNRRDGADAALGLMADKDYAVRTAAIRAVGKLGGPDCVGPLANIAGTGTGHDRTLATLALARLRGNDINRTMVRKMVSADAPVRQVLIQALAARGASEAAPELLRLAQDGDPATRAAATRALGKVLGPQHTTEVVRLLVSASSDDERRVAAEAVRCICLRADRDDAALLAGPIVAGIGDADVSARCELLGLLPMLAEPKALKAVRADAKHADEAVRAAAIKAMSGWPDTEPAPDLLSLASTAEPEKHRLLAFRGYIQLIHLESAVERKAAMCRRAAELVERKDEKKLLLSCLSHIPHADALALAQVYLTDPATREEACASVVRIASRLGPEHRDAVARALGQVVEVTKNGRRRGEAESILKRHGLHTP